MPQSKKTRALLAYLALTRRPQRRDHLCVMLWDLTDDPRAALRWSLTKLREILDDSDTRRVEADRERVAVRLEETGVDLLDVRCRLDRGVDDLTTADLEAILDQFRGDFLEGLDLPEAMEFQAWCLAEREQAKILRGRILGEILQRLSDSPEAAIPYARELAQTEPENPSHRETVARLLERSRRTPVESLRAGARLFHALDRAGDALVTDSRPRQEIRFCTTADNVRLAYATSGQGEPIVKTANWLNHLEFDWESPVWRHLTRGLTRQNRLVRYDERGNGLSDWDVPDITFEGFVNDLETVVDAAGLDRFTLLGISQGAAVSIVYALRHPERVSRLVLHGGFARGSLSRSPEEAARRKAMMVLMKEGWGQDHPAFRQLFTSLFVPDANEEQARWFNELQRITTSPEIAIRIAQATSRIDIVDLLPRVAVPTLVLHSRREAVVPFEQGRLLATRIPGARFVSLESRNHLILEEEPAWTRFLAEVTAFLTS